MVLTGETNDIPGGEATVTVGFTLIRVELPEMPGFRFIPNECDDFLFTLPGKFGEEVPIFTSSEIAALTLMDGQSVRVTVGISFF